ncbi:MAG: wax ester/triacylglycerol synthase family O-acyltransferase [Acidimicrobiia bacterium]
MRMSDAEAIMWAVEKDPALRSDFTNITVLDGRPDEGRVRAKLDAALDEIPRLSQRVVSPPLRLAPPEWRDDPTLDLDYHLRKVGAPAPGGTRELLDVAAAFSAAPLDRSRPLWEFTLVEGLEGGRSALLQKVHHAVTDGVGGLKLSLSLVDFEPDPAPAERPTLGPAQQAAADAAEHEPVDPVNRTTPLDVLSDALTFNVRNSLGAARRGIDTAGRLLAHPDEARRGIADAAALAASVRRQVLVTEPSRSELLRPRSLGRRLEVLRVPLEPAKRAASALGGSLNDLFVTAVAGALGSYHDRMGEPCDELRMAMPVNLRTDKGEAAGNNFAPSRVLVPVGPKEPAARFDVIRERLAQLKREPALGAAGSLAGLLAALPTALLVTLTRSQARTIDFATSNLRGSPVDLYVGGARIAANYPMGPRTGCALNVTLLSYTGSLDLGLNLDPAAVTDPAALLECLDESFTALLAS